MPLSGKICSRPLTVQAEGFSGHVNPRVLGYGYGFIHRGPRTEMARGGSGRGRGREEEAEGGKKNGIG